MAEQVTEHHGLIGTAESMFLIRDAEHDPAVTPAGAIEDSPGQLAGSNGRLIVVRATDVPVQVHIHVQVRDTPPPGGGDTEAWEAERTLPLRSHSGKITVEQLYSASPPDLAGITLPAGPGDYTVEISCRGRAQLRDRDTDIRRRTAGRPVGELIRQLQDLHGIERYCIRIWPTTMS